MKTQKIVVVVMTLGDSTLFKFLMGGHNFCILSNKVPIGSISYVHKGTEIASFGMWISSEYWNKGLGTQVLKIFKKIVKENGYIYLTGTIQKWNPRSKRMCEKCGATFKEDENKWYPTFILRA